GRETPLPRLAGGRRPSGSKTEPVLAADVLAEPASHQVVTGERAGLRVPEVALVERGCRVEQLEQPFAAAASRILLRARLLVLELAVEAVSQPLDSAGEVELLRFAHERDQVALSAATEAGVALVG